jgi:hypothetical protein
LGLALPVPTQAASDPITEKGLLITPLRQFISADAGTTKQSTFSVANLTDQPLTINLLVKQFSVTDYVYTYTFDHPDNDWLHISVDTLTLQPHKTQDIPFSITIPAKSAPGGHYYTLFASSSLASQGIHNTIQAVDLIYLTVNGQLTTVSHLKDSSIHWLSFGHDIGFKLQPVNTGNVYSFVYVSGQLHGLFVRPPQTSSAHLLMPGKVRELSGSIAAPVLPGIYKATYGYKTTSNWIIQETHWVVFIPPWFIAFLLVLFLLAGRYLPRPKSPVPPSDDSADD